MEKDEEFDIALPRKPDGEDLDRILQRIQRANPAWKANTFITLGHQQWRPHLVRGKRVLEIHLADRLRPYLVKRLRAASAAGYTTVVALPFERLWDPVIVFDLLNVGAEVMVIDSSGKVNGKPSLVLAALGENEVRPSLEVRRNLGRLGWEISQARARTKHLRGKRLEALICFMLAQVMDFRVVECNLRTATEEIDIVVQHRGTERCWAMVGYPHILFEVKNWSAPVDQNVISAFRSKMQGTRDTVRLGFVIAANGFTKDAELQELRFSSGDLTIALVGPKELSAWIDDVDPDGYLERIARQAMLR